MKLVGIMLLGVGIYMYWHYYQQHQQERLSIGACDEATGPLAFFVSKAGPHCKPLGTKPSGPDDSGPRYDGREVGKRGLFVF